MNMKSLQSNPDLFVISFKKRTKPSNERNQLYYREIGVNTIEGPYCYSGSNEYRIDVTYQDNPEIYSEFLTFHSIFFAYNQTRFGAKFKKYWQNICNLLPATIINGWIIFVNGKYLLISSIASEEERYAFPGYESRVAICGGKQIDQKAKYDSFISYRNIKYKSDDIWFVDYGELFEVVSKSTSNFRRVSDMRNHKDLYKIRTILHAGLQTIPGKLKLNNYGEDFTWKYKFIRDFYAINAKNTPQDIINLCLLFYSICDEFEQSLSDPRLIYDKKHMIVSKSDNCKEILRYYAFGKFAVQRGQKRSWKFKIVDSEFYRVTIAIGIIPTKIIQQKFDFNNNNDYLYENNRYQLMLKNGKISDGKNVITYCLRPLKMGAAIEMELDMSQNHRFAKLSYSLNNVSLGVAFDKIPNYESYTLCVSFERRDKLQIIPTFGNVNKMIHFQKIPTLALDNLPQNYQMSK